MSEEFKKDLLGREMRKATGKGAIDTVSVILYQHQEALTVVARASLHTSNFPNQLDYVGHLKSLGALQQPTEATRGATVTWQATTTLEVLSVWRGQANLQRATLESSCTQLLYIIARLLPKLVVALAEYTWDNPPREYLNGEDITSVSIVLYSI